MLMDEKKTIDLFYLALIFGVDIEELEKILDDEPSPDQIQT